VHFLRGPGTFGAKQLRCSNLDMMGGGQPPPMGPGKSPGTGVLRRGGAVNSISKKGKYKGKIKKINKKKVLTRHLPFHL
jgi:hypothetical protein